MLPLPSRLPLRPQAIFPRVCILLRTTPDYTRSVSSIPNTVASKPLFDSADATSLRPKRKPEPWINPESLADTLEQHREANRKRRAVDGNPKDEVRHARRHNKSGKLPEKTQNTQLQSPAKRAAPVPSRVQDDEEVAVEQRELSWDWKITTALPRGLTNPWIIALEKTTGLQVNVPASQRLNDEIRAFDKYLTPTQTEVQAAQKAYAEICNVISAALLTEDLGIELIGSRATGLATPLSDLDINLKAPRWQTIDDTQRLAILKQLHRTLRYGRLNSTEASDVNVHRALFRTVVPIIECVHLRSALTFQVQFSQGGYESLELTKAFVAEYPTLRSLYLVIRQLLLMRGLTIGSHGGMTSYPLLNIIVTSLKLGSASKDRSALGAQLLEFLDFVSDIDFSSTAIRYHPTGSSGDDLGFELDATMDGSLTFDPVTALPKLRRIKNRPSDTKHLLSLQDPADAMNDLGKSIHLSKSIQETFIQVRHHVRRAMAMWDKKHDHGSDMRTHGTSLLSWCLEGDYSHFEGARQSLKVYGTRS